MECPRCAEEKHQILTKFVNNIDNIIYRSVICDNCKLIFNTEEKSVNNSSIIGRVYAIRRKYDCNKRKRIDKERNKITTIERITTVTVYDAKINKTVEVSIEDYTF